MCRSVFNVSVSDLTSRHPRRRRSNYADYGRRRNNIVWSCRLWSNPQNCKQTGHRRIVFGYFTSSPIYLASFLFLPLVLENKANNQNLLPVEVLSLCVYRDLAYSCGFHRTLVANSWQIRCVEAMRSVR